jgi:L-asparaginase
MKKETIPFILMGGTIDSYYESARDTAVPSKKSNVPAYIKGLKLYDKTIFSEICMKDSRSLDQNDLREMLETIEKSKNKRIIITHGTYTMPDSARYLKAHLKRKDQTIVFTGSMIPLIGFSPSDAAFNLGYALAKVEKLEPGIYLCMNGTVFSPEEVAKFISEGRFISISDIK